MTYADFIKEFSSGKIRPAYFVTGVEEFLAETAVKKLTDALLKPDERTWNLSVFYGKDADGLLDALTALPILSRYRVTVVRQVQDLSEKLLDEVIRYLKSPSEDCCLILWADKLDKRSHFFKEISGTRVATIDCPKPNQRELSGWMTTYISQLGKKLDPDALGRLTAVNWPGLRELAGELDRLALMVGDSPVIRAADIDELGGGSFAFERWKLTEAVGSANITEALDAVDNLQRWGTKPIQIINDLQRLFINMWQIQWYLKHNQQSQAEKTIKLHPFVLKKYSGYVRGMSPNAVDDGILRILEADLAIKQGLRPETLEVGLLVADLVRLVGPNRIVRSKRG